MSKEKYKYELATEENGDNPAPSEKREYIKQTFYEMCERTGYPLDKKLQVKVMTDTMNRLMERNFQSEKEWTGYGCDMLLINICKHSSDCIYKETKEKYNFFAIEKL